LNTQEFAASHGEVARGRLRLVYDDAVTQGERMSRPAGTYAIFETSQGNIVVRLLESEAPKTVANFIGLAEGTKEFTNEKTGQKEKKPFYDGLIFHRVIPQFMIQGGCPQGSGWAGRATSLRTSFIPR